MTCCVMTRWEKGGKDACVCVQEGKKFYRGRVERIRKRRSYTARGRRIVYSTSESVCKGHPHQQKPRDNKEAGKQRTWNASL